MAKYWNNKIHLVTLFVNLTSTTSMMKLIRKWPKPWTEVFLIFAQSPKKNKSIMKRWKKFFLISYSKVELGQFFRMSEIFFLCVFLAKNKNSTILWPRNFSSSGALCVGKDTTAKYQHKDWILARCSKKFCVCKR